MDPVQVPSLQQRVDGFGLQGKQREDRLVDLPQWLVADEGGHFLDAEAVLARADTSRESL